MENNNDNSKLKTNIGEFRLPRDVNRRIRLLKKLKALKKETPARIVVRPYQNWNKDKNVQKSLSVSIPIQHYNKAETIENDLPSKQNSNTATETAINDMGLSYMGAYNDFIVNQGPDDLNKNISDHGSDSSPEIIMGSNQEQTINIRHDVKTTEIIQDFGSIAQSSTSKFIPEVSSNQFHETLHGSGSIGDDDNLNVFRSVRQSFQQPNQKSSKHKLPSIILERPPKYKLCHNNPVALKTNESIIQTSNQSAIKIYNNVRYPETPSSVKTFNKEIQTNTEVKHQSTYVEHEYNTVETQTDSPTVTEEQNDILEFVKSNDITLETIKEFLKNRDNGTTEHLNNHKQQTTDNENKTDTSQENGNENLLAQTLLSYSNQYKLTLKIIIDFINGDAFQIIFKKANEPLDVKLNTILKYLQQICNDNSKQKESNKRNEQSDSEVPKKKATPNNVNDITDQLSSSTMSNEITISNTDNRNKTTSRMQATLQKNSQSPAQQRAPFMNDTRIQWSPRPNPPQHFQPQLPPQPRPIFSRESMIEYPRMMHAQTLQQPRPIRPQNLPNVLDRPINISNISDHSVPNAQNNRFASHQAQTLDRQQYQIQQERYRQMEFQKMAWESHRSNNPNDMRGDFEVYSGGQQGHH